MNTMNKTEKDLLEFISLINGSYGFEDSNFVEEKSDEEIDGSKLWVYSTAVGITTEIFTKGNCGNFALALYLFMDKMGSLVEVSGDYTHILYRSESGRLYDIHGDVTDNFSKEKSLELYGEIELLDIHMEEVQEDWTGHYSFELRRSAY